MNPFTAQEAYNQIDDYISGQGGTRRRWYSGVTSDWKNRLFVEHKVPPDHHWYIACKCASEKEARAVQVALVGSGCDGGSEELNSEGVYAYAYLKSSETNP